MLCRVRFLAWLFIRLCLEILLSGLLIGLALLAVSAILAIVGASSDLAAGVTWVTWAILFLVVCDLANDRGLPWVVCYVNTRSNKIVGVDRGIFSRLQATSFAKHDASQLSGTILSCTAMSLFQFEVRLADTAPTPRT